MATSKIASAIGQESSSSCKPTAIAIELKAVQYISEPPLRGDPE